MPPALAAELYGLDIVGPRHRGPPTTTRRGSFSCHETVSPLQPGHDKTSLVIYQRKDVPGSLLSILQEFAARSINLTKLESRPTKTNLGDYCFIIDLEGHVVDEVVADCLRNLKMKQGPVKFLGSYPAAAHNGAEVRAAASADWQAAKGWVEAIRRGEAPGGLRPRTPDGSPLTLGNLVNGEMAERTIASVLKTVVSSGTGGSNPPLSAF